MAYFDYGPRYVFGRLAKTPFEESYETPRPAIYDEHTMFVSFADFVDTALDALNSWAETYRLAVGEFVLFPFASKTPEMKLNCGGMPGPLDEFRQRQIKWILDDDAAFDHAISASRFAEFCGYGFQGYWDPEAFANATPEHITSYYDDVWREYWPRASPDVAAWLDSHEFIPSVPYRTGVMSKEAEEAADRLAAQTALSGYRTSEVGVGEQWEGTEWQTLRRQLDLRFGDYTTLGELLTNCQEPKSIQAYRWNFDCEDEVNFIREAYLAGVRWWLERILSNRIPFCSRDDFAAFDRLSRIALGIVREAYTHEAPSTLLGEDELDILRLAFPFLSDLPAESWVDEEELRREWDTLSDAARDEVGGSADEYVIESRFFSFSLYNDVCRRWYEQPPRRMDTDFECRRVGLAFAKWIATEASRAGFASHISVADIYGEQEALKIISGIAIECAATLELNFAEVPVEAVSSAESEEPPPVFNADDECTSVSNTPPMKGLSRRQVDILTTLLKAEAFGFESKKTRIEIASVVAPRSNAESFKRPLAHLVKLRYLESTGRDGGPEGGYWLTSFGKAEAARLA